jgi:hypothetical protein
MFGEEYLEIHTDNLQYFRLRMEPRVCWRQFCMQLKSVIFLDNYYSQFYRSFPPPPPHYLLIYAPRTSLTIYELFTKFSTSFRIHCSPSKFCTIRNISPAIFQFLCFYPILRRKAAETDHSGSRFGRFPLSTERLETHGVLPPCSP